MDRPWTGWLLAMVLVACGGIEQRLDDGRTALRSGDAATARAAFTEVLEARPGDARVWALRGEARIAAGETGSGLADLYRAVELDPAHEATWRLLATHAPDPAERAEAWDQVVALADDPVEARCDRGVARLEAGDADGAVDDLDTCAKDDPRDAATWARLGEAHLAAGDPRAAWEAWERAPSPASLQPRAVHLLREQADAGDDDAAAFLTRIGASRESYLDQAARLYDAGRLQPAMEAARQAAVVHRDDSEERAHALAYSAAARARLAVDPTFAATRGAAGTLQQRRVLEEAIRECEASLDIQPSTLCHRAMGFAYLELGQAERAAHALDEALEREPDHLDTRWRRARAAAEIEDWDRVLSDLERLEPHRPDHLDLLLLKARALAEHPDHPATEALHAFDRAVERAGPAGPGSFHAHKARGLYAASLGRDDLATEDLERARALRSMPDEQVEQALASLGP